MGEVCSDDDIGEGIAVGVIVYRDMNAYDGAYIVTNPLSGCWRK
jgi:hypothetical protein